MNCRNVSKIIYGLTAMGIIMALLIYFRMGIKLNAYCYKGLLKKFSAAVDIEDMDPSLSNNKYNQDKNNLDERICSNLSWSSHPSLPRALTRKEHGDYIQLLQDLTDLFQQSNITFILADGTLLGSYMFHDIIPWDDDIDIMVKLTDFYKIKQLFLQKDVNSKFTIRSYHSSVNYYERETLKNLLQPSSKVAYLFKFKFFKRTGGIYFKRLGWRWPFIDVKFYTENSTHVWKLCRYDYSSPIKISKFYPLQQRPLACKLFPVPYDAAFVLKLKYPKFLCKKQNYDHKHESGIFISTQCSCSEIPMYYPYVVRNSSTEGYLIETLQINFQNIYSIAFNATTELLANGNPFVL